ncbi:MAG: hypothetical protein HQL52_09410 [Magnetococcales bacterium]|nr:hypothetical protein [Magnetococcales bacterium]
MKISFSGFRLAPILMAVTLAGCAQFPVVVPMPPAETHAQESAAMTEVDLIRMSHALTDALVAELQKNHPSFHRRKPLVVTSFVNRNNLDDSSALGLLISDHVASRFTQQGFSVVEPKLRNDLAIRKEQGEFILSRDIEKLSEENRAYAVVVGNYTEGRDMLDITSKMIQVRTRQVLASIDAKLPLGVQTRDLLVNNGGGPTLTVVDK